MNLTSIFDKLWRVPATGFAFLLLSIGGVCISLVHALVILPLPFAKHKKMEVARTSIQTAFRLYLITLRAMRLIELKVSGESELRRGGQIIVANHPSLLDVVLLMSMVPNANCVVKSALWKSPLTFGPVRVAGYIRNDDPDIVERCQTALSNGENLIVFPEGTRTTQGQPLQFQRGFAYLCMSVDAPIVPVFIDCFPATLLKGDPWFRVPQRTPRFRLCAEPPIDFKSSYDVSLPRTRQVRQLTRFAQNYFQEGVEKLIHSRSPEPELYKAVEH